MPFSVDDAVAILERTPGVLHALLSGLDDGWTRQTEGPGTWSPFDVVGHLIDGEETDWIPRARIILARGDAPRFESFDRTRHLEMNRDRSLGELLDRFAELRTRNVDTLREFGLTEEQLDWTAEHPELGRVTLRQHLATWTAHDLDHLTQIARAMARRYTAEVGPWREFLRIIRDPIV